MKHYTSDPHFWHINSIRHSDRPWTRHLEEFKKSYNGPLNDTVIKNATVPDVEEMNQAMVDNWNRAVGKDDTVRVVGDFSLAHRPVELIAPQLNGNLELIMGNHDHCHPAISKSEEKKANQMAFYKRYFKNIYLHLHDTIGDYEVIISHLPYQTVPNEKYAKWRPIDDGKILICGHVHNKWKHKFTERGTLMVNVGVDVWNYTPVSEIELLAYINETLAKKP